MENITTTRKRVNRRDNEIVFGEVLIQVILGSEGLYLDFLEDHVGVGQAMSSDSRREKVRFLLSDRIPVAVNEVREGVCKAISDTVFS